MSGLRKDLQTVAGLIASGASLIDIGCGEGDLLAWLQSGDPGRR
jgi:hypothetical protein